MIELPDGVHVSLHLKLPGELPLDEAHAHRRAGRAGDRRGRAARWSTCRPTSSRWREPAAGREADEDPAEIEQLVRDATGGPPRAVRFLHTDEGLVVFLTLALDPAESLAVAHATASSVEQQIRAAVPGVADVIVHTEP